MAERRALRIPVDGPLDTANPATNRPVGVLVDGVDLAHRSWGPRRGMQAQTWVGRSTYSIPAGAIPIVTFDGSSSYVKGEMPREMADLGLNWTLDVCFHATANRVTGAAVPVFQWRIDGSITAIEVGYYGTLHTSAGKPYVVVKTTSSAGVVGNTYTLVGDTALAFTSSYVSANKIVRVALRVIRDGSTLYLLDSIDTSKSTAVSSTQPHSGATTSPNSGYWLVGNDTGLGVNATFAGVLCHAILRSGAVSSAHPVPMLQHPAPRAPTVRFYTSGTLGDAAYMPDYGMFGAHGILSGTSNVYAARHAPTLQKIQGMATFTDAFGTTTGVVICGGNLYYDRVR